MIQNAEKYIHVSQLSTLNFRAKSLQNFGRYSVLQTRGI